MKKRIVKTVRDEKPFLRIGTSLLRELGFLAPGTKLLMTVQPGKLIITIDDTIEEPVKTSTDEIPAKETSTNSKKSRKSDKIDSVKIAKEVKESINKLLKSTI